MSTMAESPWRPGFNAKFWLVASTIGGGGLLAGFVFFSIGRLARRPDWWIPGPIYLVASLTFLYLMVRGPEADRDEFATAFVAVWFSSFAYAVIIVVLLRWSTRYRMWCGPQRAPLPPPPGGDTSVRAEPPAPSNVALSPDPVGLPAGLAPPPGDFYAPGPAASTAPPAPIDVNAAIDVNTAGARQLTTLPGFHPDRVKQVLAERRTRRGFGSIEEFAAAAGLAPHEFVRIRDLVVCTTPPPVPPARGRILDV